jgi:hypothetical protein
MTTTKTIYRTYETSELTREVRAALRWAREWARREHGLALCRFVQVHPYDSLCGPEWVASDRRTPAVFITVWRAGSHDCAVQEARDNCDVARQFGTPDFPTVDASTGTDSRPTWGISKHGPETQPTTKGAHGG